MTTFERIEWAWVLNDETQGAWDLIWQVEIQRVSLIISWQALITLVKATGLSSRESLDLMIEVVNITLMNELVKWGVLWWMVTGFGAFLVISGKEREGSLLLLGPAEAVPRLWTSTTCGVLGWGLPWAGSGELGTGGCWHLRVRGGQSGYESSCGIKHPKPLPSEYLELCVWVVGMLGKTVIHGFGMVGLCMSSKNVKRKRTIDSTCVW